MAVAVTAVAKVDTTKETDLVNSLAAMVIPATASMTRDDNWTTVVFTFLVQVEMVCTSFMVVSVTAVNAICTVLVMDPRVWLTVEMVLLIVEKTVFNELQISVTIVVDFVATTVSCVVIVDTLLVAIVNVLVTEQRIPVN